jgi:hypothetical protein
MDICLINKRIDELDYLKSIMIVLMIAILPLSMYVYAKPVL